MNPFEAHAKAVMDIQTVLGAGPLRTDGATLKFENVGKPVPCTHSPILDDFNLIAGGQSPKLMIENVEFLKADVGTLKIRKGVRCALTIKRGEPAIALQVWTGGLLPGGHMYRVSMVDVNYKA